jgi:hypothetical protein
MGDTVYANKFSVLNPGSSGKSMAAFPDTCLCPPPSPTGPIPTPLPNNAMASDVTECASSVLIEGKETATKKSYISRSVGNEVSKPTGGGIVTHAVQGKAYFASYSMDVLAENEPVVRHLDLATHNHASQSSNTPPWPTVAKGYFKKGGVCAKNAKACQLFPYKPDKCKQGAVKKTGHHVVPMHLFVKPGKRAANMAGKKNTTIAAAKKYNGGKAPVVCVSGTSWHSKGANGKLLQHGEVHRRMDLSEAIAHLAGKGWSYKQAKEAAAKSVCQVIKGCTQACIKAQLDAYHKQTCGIKDSTKVQTSDHIRGDIRTAAEKVVNKAKKKARGGSR